jgi:hypothetical protein
MGELILKIFPSTDMIANGIDSVSMIIDDGPRSERIALNPDQDIGINLEHGSAPKEY